MPGVTMTPAVVAGGAGPRLPRAHLSRDSRRDNGTPFPSQKRSPCPPRVVTSHGHMAQRAMRDQGQPQAAPKGRASPRHPQLLTCY